MVVHAKGTNLRDREIKFIPDLRYDKFETGTIHVRVKIDKYGQVERAKWKRGKSDHNSILKEIAEGLASEFVFEKGRRQIGVMTFTFTENPNYQGETQMSAVVY